MALVEMKVDGLDGVLELLQSLPSEIVSRKGGPAKKALRAGALVIWKQALANLDAQTHNTTSKEKILSTGFLRQNVVVTRGKPPSDGNGERYIVRILKKKYLRRGRSTTTTKTGSLLEFGSAKQAAEPWMNPAVATKGGEAIAVIVSTLNSEIDAIVKKLGR